jgi:hypothetical protein
VNVRALFQAIKVANATTPYDTLQLKVFYPAQRAVGDAALSTSAPPFKVVIFFSGINCSAQLYQWLAVNLSARGLVVVTFDWVAENLPGIVAPMMALLLIIVSFMV